MPRPFHFATLMKPVKTVLLVLFLATSVFIQWEAHRLDSSAPGSALVGQLAPSFALLDLDGERVRLEDLRGQFVLVDFWATWCGPCRQSMPVLEQFSERMGDRLTLLSVNLKEREDVVLSYADQNDLQSRILLDLDGAITRAYQVEAIPMQFLIDSEGIVRQAVAGYNPSPSPDYS